GPAISSLLAAAGMPPLAAFADTHFHATPALPRRRATIETDRLLILGDAAGYVEPFTGEGIAWAFASAVAIVPRVLQRLELPLPRGGGREGVPAATVGISTATWTRTHRRLITPRQHLCRVLAWTLRHPRLASTAIRLLSLAPALAAPALRRVEAPFP